MRNKYKIYCSRTYIIYKVKGISPNIQSCRITNLPELVSFLNTNHTNHTDLDNQSKSPLRL